MHAGRRALWTAALFALVLRPCPSTPGPRGRPPPPRRAERLHVPWARCASANPRVCREWATSAISSRSRTWVGERAISGVSDRRVLELVWCASRDGGAERCGSGRPDEPGSREARCRRSRDGAAGGDRRTPRGGDVVPDVCVVRRDPALNPGAPRCSKAPSPIARGCTPRRSCPVSTDSQRAARWRAQLPRAPGERPAQARRVLTSW